MFITAQGNEWRGKCTYLMTLMYCLRNSWKKTKEDCASTYLSVKERFKISGNALNCANQWLIPLSCLCTVKLPPVTVIKPPTSTWTLEDLAQTKFPPSYPHSGHAKANFNCIIVEAKMISWLIFPWGDKFWHNTGNVANVCPYVSSGYSAADAAGSLVSSIPTETGLWEICWHKELSCPTVKATVSLFHFSTLTLSLNVKIPHLHNVKEDASLSPAL